MKYSDATLKNVDKEIVDILTKNTFKDRHLHDPVFTKGMFLFGKTGRGKTYILYAIKNAIEKQISRWGRVHSWVDVLYSEKRSFGSGQVSPIQRMSSEDTLMIDDIGVEKDSEWSQETFYIIIDKAYVNEIPTFISTNLSIEEFTKRYGERIMSRLEEMCDFIEIKGDDRRIN